MMDAADTFIISLSILRTRDAGSASVWWMNAWKVCVEAGLQRAIILVANDNPRGRSFWKRWGWEEVPGAVAMGIDLPGKSDRYDG